QRDDVTGLITIAGLSKLAQLGIIILYIDGRVKITPLGKILLPLLPPTTTTPTVTATAASTTAASAAAAQPLASSSTTITTPTNIPRVPIPIIPQTSSAAPNSLQQPQPKQQQQEGRFTLIPPPAANAGGSQTVYGNTKVLLD